VTKNVIGKRYGKIKVNEKAAGFLHPNKSISGQVLNFCNSRTSLLEMQKAREGTFDPGPGFYYFSV